MKVEVQSKELKGFTPIELTITIETQEEFDDLYVRMRASSLQLTMIIIVSNWRHLKDVKNYSTNYTILNKLI